VLIELVQAPPEVVAALGWRAAPAAGDQTGKQLGRSAPAFWPVGFPAGGSAVAARL